MLEKLEKDNLAIQKQRYDIIYKRRLEDMADQVSLFTGQDVITPSVNNKPSAGDADDIDGIEAGTSRLVVAPRSSARESRRLQKVARREKLNQMGPEVEEGLSTDDDLDPDDMEEMHLAISELHVGLNRLLDDVKAEEFLTPDFVSRGGGRKGIKESFEEWRRRFKDDYEKAWGGLGLMNVLEFWARKEMGGWNPLRVS
jgi:GC-rich sequence DNA-binding factor